MVRDSSGKGNIKLKLIGGDAKIVSWELIDFLVYNSFAGYKVYQNNCNPPVGSFLASSHAFSKKNIRCSRNLEIAHIGMALKGPFTNTC